MFKQSTALLLLATAIALATGCGSSGEEPLSKAEFIKQANQICNLQGTEVTERLSTYAEEQPPNQTQDELYAGAVKTILLPITEARIDEIGSLAPPQGDEKQVNAYLSAEQNGVDEIKRQEATSFAALNDSLIEFEKPFKPAAKLAQEYGFKECQ